MMQDRFANHSEDSEAALHIFCIFDGHGGSLASEFASRTMVDEVTSRIKPGMTDDEVR
jgi:serine/threonine protein phosphatase PrpC